MDVRLSIDRRIHSVMLAAGLAAGVVACGGNQAGGVPVPDEELAVLRSDVRDLLRPGCGSCHTAGLPTAKPAAVAVFDFRNEDWSAHMTVSQLRGLASRSKDMAEGPRSKVEGLVSGEIARREAGSAAGSE